MSKQWIIVIQKLPTDKLRGLLGTTLVYFKKHGIKFNAFRALQDELWIFATGTGYEMVKIKNDSSIPILRISKHTNCSFFH